MRDFFRAKRRALPPDDARSAATGLLEEWKKAAWTADHVALYAPMDGELSCAAIFQALRRAGRGCYFPRVTQRGLEFYGADTWESAILQKADAVFDGSHFGLMLVPGIAFDAAGNRIGFGKGYYDRFLKDYRGIKVGVAYEFQIVEHVVHEKWDVPMDWILTDERCLQTRGAPR